MKEKAKAWGNAQDKSSKFALERKQQPTSFRSYTKLTLLLEIEPNEKFDIESKLNKWTGGTANGLESD